MPPSAPRDDLERAPAEELDDDAYFAQLRGALDDEAPLGPREEATSPSNLLTWREEATTSVAEAPSLYDQGQSGERRPRRRLRRERRPD